MDKRARIRWRVQGIPPGVEREALCEALTKHAELNDTSPDDHRTTNGATVLTLATDIRAINPKQTATVTFRHVPSTLETLPLRDRLTISIELSASQNSRITIDRSFLGLTTLRSPPNDYAVEEQLNILAISGLGGHALGSFVSKNDGHLWLVDSLLEDLPFARIMVYGYESRVSSSHSFSTIKDLASALYVPMRDILQMHQSTIPLIVVAHSLGGLLVKDVLIQMMEAPEDFALLQSVVAVLFFGVPHDGMDIMSLRAIVGDQPNSVLLESLAGSLSRINSPILATQRREFSRVLKDTGVEVFCFYETENSPSAERLPDGRFTMTGPRCCLVSVESATSCFRTEASRTSHEIAVTKTHSDLVKFEVHDPDYQNTRSVMDRIHAKRAGALHKQHLPVERRPHVTDEFRRAFLDSLEFDHMHDRRWTIGEAYGATCDWLLGCPQYKSWLDPEQLESHGLLWIKGNAGAGKSTMMRFAVDNAPPDCRVISFFFNARGHEMERSATGMYRALLRQLLGPLALCDLQKTLESAKIHPLVAFQPASAWLARPDMRKAWLSTLKENADKIIPRTWRLPVLQKLFREALQHFQDVSITCYIDALDECDIDEVWDMVGFMESLGPTAKLLGVQLRFCFASRHYPAIFIEKAVSLILDRHIHHRKAIISYIKAKLRIGTGRLYEEVRFKLQSKAAGVFMWVVLMTAMLNRTYARGRVHELLDQLEQVPGDLNGLFRDILRQDEPNEEELRNCLLWVSFCKRPLAPSELYHAMRHGTHPNGIMDPGQESDASPTVYASYILDTSNGLVEIVEYSQLGARVQFTHESVREFLLKCNGFDEIWLDYKPNLETNGHYLLGLFCLNYIRKFASRLKIGSLDDWIDLRKTMRCMSNKHLTTGDSSFDVEAPFWRYAAIFALVHAHEAAGGGADSGPITDLLQQQALHLAYLRYLNLLSRGQGLSRGPGSYFLRNAEPQHRAEYILAEDAHCNLISACAKPEAFFEAGEEYYKAPILRALFLNHHHAVQAILERQAQSHPRLSPLRALHADYSPKEHSGQSLYQPCNNVFEFLLELDEPIVALYHPGALHDALFDSSDTRGRTLLSLVCKHGSEIGLNLLLQRNVNVNVKDRRGRSSLAFAAMSGNERVVELLLDHGADMCAIELDGTTPLHCTAAKGHESIIRLFYRRGATSIFAGQNGFTALRRAAEGGHCGAIRALVECGADINWKDETGDALLHKEWRDQQIVWCLLDNGANINVRDANHSSPLICAVKRLSLSPVNWLLDRGANVNFQDRLGRTALWSAISLGRIEIVRALIKKGANAHVRGKDGGTPRDLAINLGDPDILRALHNSERRLGSSC